MTRYEAQVLPASDKRSTSKVFYKRGPLNPWLHAVLQASTDLIPCGFVQYNFLIVALLSHTMSMLYFKQYFHCMLSYLPCL